MITKKLKAGEIVKINGIPLSLCQDTEVETHEGNAPMVWSESGEIAPAMASADTKITTKETTL